MFNTMAAVIFGGSSGIGRAVAERCINDGFKTAILSRREEKIKQAEQYFSEKFPKANVLAMACDVRDEKKIEESFKIIEDKLGSVEVLINAAGINQDGLLLKTSKSTMDTIIETNLIGTMLTCKSVVKSMMKNRKGCIVNIGSIVGTTGNIGQSCYSASKAGLIGFTKSLAKELGPRGIRVNLIAPGLTETSMTENLTSQQLSIQMNLIKRLAKPQDVANAAAMLIKASYVTGAVIYVDGGLHLNI